MPTQATNRRSKRKWTRPLNANFSSCLALGIPTGDAINGTITSAEPSVSLRVNQSSSVRRRRQSHTRNDRTTMSPTRAHFSLCEYGVEFHRARLLKDFNAFLMFNNWPLDVADVCAFLLQFKIYAFLSYT
jgi:hypothetical protein